MGKVVEKIGKTVQEAVGLALEELNMEEDKVEIEVLEEGSKGIFGLGGKQAKVRVTEKDRAGAGSSRASAGSRTGVAGTTGGEEKDGQFSDMSESAGCALDFILKVLEKMSIAAAVDVMEDDESVQFRISGDDVGIIIGRHGETLDSLQYLTSLVVNRIGSRFKRVIIDTENYRQKREETLVRLADRLAERVVREGKSITLEPMNPYERRIIHASLQENKYIRTYSVGDEPNRKVVISIK